MRPCALGKGRAVTAGGMVYISSVGPVDPETAASSGRRSRSRPASACATSRRCSRRHGSSLDKVVWANWSLRDPTDFDIFNEEWVKWFPGDAPVGQSTLMPPLQRRAGFRVSIGVIAQQ